MMTRNKSKRTRQVVYNVIFSVALILVWLLLGYFRDGIEGWVLIFAILFIMWVSPLWAWVDRWEAKRSTTFPNEAPAQWRKLDHGTAAAPFSGRPKLQSCKFRATPDGVYCDQEFVPRSEVLNAVRYVAGQYGLVMPTVILRITTSYAVYDIAISNARLDQIKLPFEVTNAIHEMVSKRSRRLMFLVPVALVLLWMILSRLLK